MLCVERSDTVSKGTPKGIESRLIGLPPAHESASETSEEEIWLRLGTLKFDGHYKNPRPRNIHTGPSPITIQVVLPGHDLEDNKSITLDRPDEVSGQVISVEPMKTQVTAKTFGTLRETKLETTVLPASKMVDQRHHSSLMW